MIEPSSRSKEKTDICLIHMPYGPVEWPSLGIGLLLSAAMQAGFSARAIYASIWFAERLGYNQYFTFAKLQTPESSLADWTFSHTCFPDFEPEHEEYLSYVLKRERVLAGFYSMFGGDQKAFKQWLFKTREAATPFVDEVAQKVLDGKPKLVGCSAAFQQNCSSLALLRRLKQLAPDIITVMGGPSCEGEMGLAMKQAFPWVDYVVSGEADELFPNLCHLVLNGSGPPLPDAVPYGVFCEANANQTTRENHGDCGATVPTAMIHRMDNLPYPDYRDYFQTLNNSRLKVQISGIIPFETSRGCWKGNLKPCRFCGLNGNRILYRSKKPGIVLEQLHRLRKRYGGNAFMATDTILNSGFFKTLLPQIAENKEGYRIFFETSSMIGEKEVALLAKAGILWIQPGIETLNDGIVQLLDKGNSAIQSIALLKFAIEQGVRCSWNMLCRVPGEEEGLYREMMPLFPLLHHLQPPSSLSMIRFDRFSCYHQEPERYGLTLHPYPTYAYVYPFSDSVLRDLVYFFFSPEMEKRPGNFERIYEKVQREIKEWRRAFWGHGQDIRSAENALLLLTEERNASIIRDTRGCAEEQEVRIEGLCHSLHSLCRHPVSLDKILREINGGCESSFDFSIIRNELETLIQRKLVVQIGDLYLALATRKPRRPLAREFPHPAPEESLFDWFSDLDIA